MLVQIVRKTVQLQRLRRMRRAKVLLPRVIEQYVREEMVMLEDDISELIQFHNVGYTYISLLDLARNDNLINTHGN